MEKREQDLREIPLQLNDKLMVVWDVLRNMRDEDLSIIHKLVDIESDFRGRVKAEIPVEAYQRKDDEPVVETI